MDLSEINEKDFSFINRHPWEQARMRFLRYLVKIHLGPKVRNVVDIGCGDCYLLKKLAQCFPEAKFTGIDIALDSESIAKLTKEVNRPNAIIENSIDNISKEEKVNCITLFDVLEHIENDKDYLKDIANRSFISPGCFFFITVPSFSLLSTDHDFKLKHHRRYRNTQLQQTVRESELKIIEHGYFFHSLLVPRIIQKIFAHFGCQSGSGLNWHGGKIKTLLFKTILFYDALICRYIKKIFYLKIPGLSCYMICKKP